MEVMASQFTDLQGAMVGGGVAAIVESAKRLEDVLPRLAEVAPQRNTESSGEFQAYAGRLDSLLAEITSLATQERLDGASQAFAELRNSCVSCHVKFRENNDVIGLFPAVGNTITGKVHTWDVDGVPQESGTALVFLERLGQQETHVNHRDNPALAQESLQFSASILPVVRGATVDFPNDDTVLHNVFSLSRTAPFDLGIYKQGTSRSVHLEETGLVRVYCNLHPEMAASIVVLENPYFSLTDEGGSYVISGIPDGEYTVRAWNDRQGEGSQEIEIAGGELVEVYFEVHDKLRPVQHKNKFGRRYPDKY